MKWPQIKFWLLFFWKTWRSPNAYRRLFRSISSCYLTPGAPGRANVAGVATECVTSTAPMIMVLDGAHVFYIDRQALVARRGQEGEDLQLWDPRCAKLRTVFNHMIREGVPYKMSDAFVTHTGL